MISAEEVKHIAKLARLELTEEEVAKMQKDLSAILDYFNLLEKAPKPEISVNNAGEGLKVMRKDEEGIRDADLAEKLIESAPDKKDGYIKVKAIL